MISEDATQFFFYQQKNIKNQNKKTVPQLICKNVIKSIPNQCIPIIKKLFDTIHFSLKPYPLTFHLTLVTNSPT